MLTSHANRIMRFEGNLKPRRPIMVRSLFLAVLVAAPSYAAEPSQENVTDARVTPLEEV